MGQKGNRRRRGKSHPEGSTRMSTALLRALDHPLRREALRKMHISEVPQSAKALSKSIDAPATTISYHLKVLSLLNVITLVSKRRVRAALEKGFVSKIADHEQAIRILADTEGCDEALRLHL